MQLDLLWKYQQADVEVDRYENEMRNDPDRQKLLKHRTFLVDQQNTMKKLENDVSIMADRLEAVRDEAQRLESQLAEQKARFVDNPTEDVETVREGLKQIQRTCDLLSRYEQELQKLRKDADARDRQQREIRVRAAKVKAEFDQLKGQYDQKFQQQKAKLEEIKAEADKEAVGIDPKLMQRWLTSASIASRPWRCWTATAAAAATCRCRRWLCATYARAKSWSSATTAAA